MMTTDQLVAAVRRHAVSNYEAGWDVVVEAVSDDQIVGVIVGAVTAKEAIANVRDLYVDGWVNSNLNARWGDDDDWQLGLAERARAERNANAGGEQDEQD